MQESFTQANHPFLAVIAQYQAGETQATGDLARTYTLALIPPLEQAAGESQHLLAAVAWPAPTVSDAGRLEEVYAAIASAGNNVAGVTDGLAAWKTACDTLAADVHLGPCRT